MADQEIPLLAKKKSIGQRATLRLIKRKGATNARGQVRRVKRRKKTKTRRRKQYK